MIHSFKESFGMKSYDTKKTTQENTKYIINTKLEKELPE